MSCRRYWRIKAASSDWPKGIALQGTADDPLDRPETDASDRDDPAASSISAAFWRAMAGISSCCSTTKSAAGHFLEQAEAGARRAIAGGAL
ncbi:MAG: hypothetical protein MZV64_10045 [Ignavibacteriales bacterium]|nr:hypothetical protein [Ignavibacteriales bacterium]